MMLRTAVLARESDTTVYDATFAALAESRQATFVTADERLVRGLAGLSLVRFLCDVSDA
jgi:predicted nucleic acid-binding protein